MSIPFFRDKTTPSIEERLSSLTRQPQPALDIVGLATLVALALILPLWPALHERAFNDVLGQAFSVYLLAALGMLLALRCGAIDLSVWANMAVGGAVAATVIRSAPPGHNVAALALAAGGAAGLVTGLINALAVKRLRLPSPVATLIMAALITGAMTYVGVGEGNLTIPDTTFAHWHLVYSIAPDQPADGPDDQSPPVAPGSAKSPANAPVRFVATLTITRMLLVAGAFSLVLIALMIFPRRARRSPHALPIASPGSDHNPIVLALAVSGLLSALGGAFWLIDQPSTPVPDHLIGSMRIPAAAILAGALLFAGPGRTLLSVMCLPPALAVASAWRWGWPGNQEYQPQMLVLIGAVLLLQFCARKAIQTRGPMITAAVISAGALILLAAAGRAQSFTSQQLLRWSGIVLIGFAYAFAVKASRQNRATTHSQRS